MKVGWDVNQWFDVYVRRAPVLVEKAEVPNDYAALVQADCMGSSKDLPRSGLVLALDEHRRVI
jgi:hypothetical protein